MLPPNLGRSVYGLVSKPSTLYERLTEEKNRLEMQLDRLDLALSEIEKLRQLRADKSLIKGLASPDLRAPK
jgi:hypothetical protein